MSKCKGVEGSSHTSPVADSGVVKYVVKLPEITLLGYPNGMTKAQVVKECLEYAFNMSLTDRDLKIMVKESKVKKVK